MLDDLSDPNQSLMGMQKRLQRTPVSTGIRGVGVTVVEFISRTEYDLLSPPESSTLYAIDESA